MKKTATWAGNTKDETATRQVREHSQRTARLSRPRGRTAPARLECFADSQTFTVSSTINRNSSYDDHLIYKF